MPGVTFAVLIGRFQPPHAAHLQLMQGALARHGRLLVLLGSANMARSAKNPFSAGERARLVRSALGVRAAQLRVGALPDRFEGARWAQDVREAVGRLGWRDPVLVGHEKDATGSYLHWFPDWPLDALPGVPGLNATDLRRALWRRDWGALAAHVHPSTLAWLEAFALTPVFARLAQEAAAIDVERARHPADWVWRERLGLYREGPLVALARRRGPIGAGLWSLPEVHGEGGALLGVFTHPSRSLLGASEARVERLEQRPAGAEARPLRAMLTRPRRFFEDHAVIIERLSEG